MKKNNRSYLLLAAAISLSSVLLGSSLTRAALLPTTILNHKLWNNRQKIPVN